MIPITTSRTLEYEDMVGDLCGHRPVSEEFDLFPEFRQRLNGDVVYHQSICS